MVAVTTALAYLGKYADKAIDEANKGIKAYELIARSTAEHLHAQMQTIAQGIWANYMNIGACYPITRFPEYLENKLSKVASLDEANSIYNSVVDEQMSFSNELYPARYLVYEFRKLEAKVEAICSTYHDTSSLPIIDKSYVERIEQLTNKLPVDGEMYNVFQAVECRLRSQHE